MIVHDVGFAELLTQLKIISRIQAAQLRTIMTQQEIIGLLSTTGASNQEIADVVDTSAATVGTTLVRLRKKEKKRKQSLDSRLPGFPIASTRRLIRGENG